MSRILVYGLDNYVVGELRANAPRSWKINDSGESTISLAADQVHTGLQFGRMVMVEHAKLPIWAGMIDTPWGAILPVSLTAYNAGYLLTMRSPTNIKTITGSTGAIVKQLLRDAQVDEDLYIREGEIDCDDESRPETFDRRTYWVQILELVENAGYELLVRPELGKDNRLLLYVDMKSRLGVDTDTLLHDGTGGNMQITNAQVDGLIYNVVTGYSSQQTPVMGEVQIDEHSIGLYRRRTEMVQYSNVESKSALNTLANTELKSSKSPTITLTANVLDVGSTFFYLRPGNLFLVRASQLYLPGGVRGWTGYGRIMAMEYDELNNIVSVKLEGEL